MARAKRRAPQRHARGIELGPGADEGERGIDVLEVTAEAHELARLAVRFAEMAEVEGQHGEARGREPALVLVEHHGVGGAAAMDQQHDGMRRSGRGSVSQAAQRSPPEGNVKRVVIAISFQYSVRN